MEVVQEAKNEECLLMSLPPLCIISSLFTEVGANKCIMIWTFSTHLLLAPNCAARSQIANQLMQLEWRPTSFVDDSDGFPGHSAVCILGTALNIKSQTIKIDKWYFRVQGGGA